MRSVLLAGAIAMVGCKTAAVISGAATVATGAAGAALVAGSEERSTERGAGVVLLSYAIVGLCITSAIIASAGERAPAAGTWGPGVAGGGAVSRSAEPGAAPTASEDNHARSDVLHYDRTGAAAGRIDTRGTFYDRTGAPAGRIDEHGRFYDRTGAPAGRVDDRGSYYDRTGAPAGRVDDRGQFYDRTGAAAGRIDEHGNVYDRTGAFAGRVDPSCDDACRRATVGRILLD